MSLLAIFKYTLVEFLFEKYQLKLLEEVKFQLGKIIAFCWKFCWLDVSHIDERKKIWKNTLQLCYMTNEKKKNNFKANALSSNSTANKQQHMDFSMKTQI